MTKLCKLLFLFFLVLICVTESDASFVSEEEARMVAGGWLNKNPSPMGAQLGSEIKEIRRYHGKEYGEPGYYVVFLNPKGWVIIPADDTFEPKIPENYT